MAMNVKRMMEKMSKKSMPMKGKVPMKGMVKGMDEEDEKPVKKGKFFKREK
jgi:hypothetical protein